jgi:hypothetical protein
MTLLTQLVVCLDWLVYFLLVFDESYLKAKLEWWVLESKVQILSRKEIQIKDELPKQISFIET